MNDREAAFIMVQLKRFGLLVALCALLGFEPGAQGADCRLKQFFSIDIQKTADGKVIFPASYNDQTFEIFLDTVSVADGLIKESVANRLNLPLINKINPYIIDEKGRFLNTYIEMKNFKIGSTTAPEAKLYVIKDNFNNYFGPKTPDAQIAMNYFRGLDAEFDLKNNKINFFSSKHCPGNVVYWAKEWVESRLDIDKSYRYFLDVKIDGEKLNAIVDLARSVNVISYEVVKDNSDLHIKEKDIGRLKKFKKLEIAGITLRDVEILVDHARPRNKIDFHIGSDFFTKVHTYFSYDEDKIYVTSAQ